MTVWRWSQCWPNLSSLFSNPSSPAFHSWSDQRWLDLKMTLNFRWKMFFICITVDNININNNIVIIITNNKLNQQKQQQHHQQHSHLYPVPRLWQSTAACCCLLSPGQKDMITIYKNDTNGMVLINRHNVVTWRVDGYKKWHWMWMAPQISLHGHNTYIDGHPIDSSATLRTLNGQNGGHYPWNLVTTMPNWNSCNIFATAGLILWSPNWENPNSINWHLPSQPN